MSERNEADFNVKEVLIQLSRILEAHPFLLSRIFSSPKENARILSSMHHAYKL